jgi:hypothetical protein
MSLIFVLVCVRIVLRSSTSVRMLPGIRMSLRVVLYCTWHLTGYKLSTRYLQMLYILRPLIYAALVHQIEVYRSKQQFSDANSGTAGSSASGAAGGNTSTSSSGSTGGTRAEGGSVFTRVLDTLTVDALLGAVALTVAFVSAVSVSLFLV